MLFHWWASANILWHVLDKNSTNINTYKQGRAKANSCIN